MGLLIGCTMDRVMQVSYKKRAMNNYEPVSVGNQQDFVPNLLTLTEQRNLSLDIQMMHSTHAP